MREYIKIENLSKNYGDVKALKNINSTIYEGELFGFIGPDGAGKTSLFRIITTLLLADTGSITIDNHDVVADYNYLRKNIGYMPGKFSLYQDLTVEENLNFFAGVFKTSIKENYHLIEDIYKQIEPFKNRRAGKLSGGMKQKLALSCALIHKPKLLVLDEPTTGVDVVSRTEFWQMLKRLKPQGITIIVSTPYMDEASLCDRVAFLHKGEILKTDTPENIVINFDKTVFSVKAKNRLQLSETLKSWEKCASAYWFGDNIHFIANQEISIDTIYQHLNKNNISNHEIEIIKPNIEDCFMDLMN